MRKRPTLHHQGKPHRIFSRWSSRSAAPVMPTFLVDMLLLTAWQIYITRLPQLIYSIDELSSVVSTISAALRAPEVAAGLTVTVGWLIALNLVPTYNRKRIVSPVDSPRHFVILTLAAGGTITLISLLTPIEAALPPLWQSAGITGALIALSHAVAAIIHKRTTPRRFRAMLLAPSGLVDPLHAHLRQYEALLHAHVVGVMRWDDHLPLMAVRLSEHFDEILAAMIDCGASTLLLAHPNAAALGDLEDLRWMLENEGLYLDTVLEPIALRSNHSDIAVAPGIAILRTPAAQDTWCRAAIKRLSDIILSALAIVILTPVWLILIVAISRYDGGPAFFIQHRVGRGGQLFPMLKFRTMVTDAERHLAELRENEYNLRGEEFTDEDGADTGVLFKLKDDPRITPIGAFLRRTSIDELPQLFNVLCGHMSLVGPRPPLPEEVERYAPRVLRKFNVRPGITGLWQVSGRSDLSWTESVRLDLYYVENRSLLIDTKILLKTVWVVVSQKGAY